VLRILGCHADPARAAVAGFFFPVSRRKQIRLAVRRRICASAAAEKYSTYPIIAHIIYGDGVKLGGVWYGFSLLFIINCFSSL